MPLKQEVSGASKEKYFHNYLELKAVLLRLQSLCSGIKNKHITFQSGITTAVSYINATGGTKSMECNDMAQQIWKWSTARNIWLSSCYIPGVTNVVADKESRLLDGSTEWSLNTKVFEDITKLWGPFKIDLFPSRLNHKATDYVSCSVHGEIFVIK